MKVNKAKKAPKNQPGDNISLEDNANKVIELTRFNVSKKQRLINYKIYKIYIENQCKKCL